jgi:hypothetical protein
VTKIVPCDIHEKKTRRKYTTTVAISTKKKKTALTKHTLHITMDLLSK